jgi:hypothetical protein
MALVSEVFTLPYSGRKLSSSKQAAQATSPAHSDQNGLAMSLDLTREDRD